MNKNYILVAILIVAFQIGIFAQDTIVQWTFPTQSGEADGGAIAANLSQIIETAGGTSDIQFKNGLTTKAAQATSWDNGKDEKNWNVEFETTGYTNIKLSSIITSGGTNPGPRDFKVQYSLDNGDWTDIADSHFQTANDWTTGALINLAIPDECNDKSLIKIRWIMTSDTATNGSVLTSAGVSKIDDIFIVGDFIDGEEELSKSSVSVYPNPATDFIIVQSESIVQLELYDINGKQVIDTSSGTDERIDITRLNSGIYILKIEDVKDKSIVLRKVMIQK